MTTKEQRANDFALEVMKIYFEHNAKDLVTDDGSIDVYALFLAYNGAYDHAFQSLIGD